ncbi:FCP1 homology domain-containing protein [Haematococcus lacustris]|uniref:FCP1 homology domain-containing protein n=1 Tax=Haematococcus lacustris TaxID=44745 RepID=A0A699YLJ9_HAELA|nr:FCP1 homology domain-containing protein [Haematococcus lacustris]
MEDGVTVVKRPVIRLEGDHLVLTRIDPAERKTSMVMRFRPGWPELLSVVAGEGKVMPWLYYRDEAHRQTGYNPSTATQSEGELKRVRDAIVQLRSSVYQGLVEVLRGVPLLLKPAPSPLPLPFVKTLALRLQQPTPLLPHSRQQGGPGSQS